MMKASKKKKKGDERRTIDQARKRTWDEFLTNDVNAVSAKISNIERRMNNRRNDMRNEEWVGIVESLKKKRNIIEEKRKTIVESDGPTKP